MNKTHYRDKRYTKKGKIKKFWYSKLKWISYIWEVVPTRNWNGVMDLIQGDTADSQSLLSGLH